MRGKVNRYNIGTLLVRFRYNAYLRCNFGALTVRETTESMLKVVDSDAYNFSNRNQGEATNSLSISHSEDLPSIHSCLLR
jgi:hypothetical protein